MTTEEAICRQRQRCNNAIASARRIMPWLNIIYERGVRIAHTSITEMDVTARFEDREEQIIALFASLSAPQDSDAFASSRVWDTASPHDMVYRRLFTLVEKQRGFSHIRFCRLMDILWQWTQDYGSVTEAFRLLCNDPDPLGTLQWMMGETIPVKDPEFRLPRFLMALMLSDDGIGQGLMLHTEPENLLVPDCSMVKQLKMTFCPIRDVEYGQVASILGRQYETDLYYLALGWEDVCQKSPEYSALVKKNYHRIFDAGGRHKNAYDCTIRCFKIIFKDL